MGWRLPTGQCFDNNIVNVFLRRMTLPAWTSWRKMMAWSLCSVIQMKQKGCSWWWQWLNGIALNLLFSSLQTSMQWVCMGVLHHMIIVALCCFLCLSHFLLQEHYSIHISSSCRELHWWCGSDVKSSCRSNYDKTTLQVLVTSHN